MTVRFEPAPVSEVKQTDDDAPGVLPEWEREGARDGAKERRVSAVAADPDRPIAHAQERKDNHQPVEKGTRQFQAKTRADA